MAENPLPNNLNETNQMAFNPQLAQQLSQLQDIQLPDPIGWWPLAYSWWILIFSIVMTLVGVAWYFLQRQRLNKYRQQALEELQQIEQSQQSPQQKIAAINQLLKQVALTAYGRHHSASLYGQAWLAFLKQRCEFIHQPDQLDVIVELAYQPENTTIQDNGTRQAYQQLLDYSAQWIKGHHQ